MLTKHRILPKWLGAQEDKMFIPIAGGSNISGEIYDHSVKQCVDKMMGG